MERFVYQDTPSRVVFESSRVVFEWGGRDGVASQALSYARRHLQSAARADACSDAVTYRTLQSHSRGGCANACRTRARWQGCG
jgi:hypothetical protein